MDPITADEIIELTLRNGNESISKIFDADVLILSTPMLPGVDDVVRAAIEELQDENPNTNNIAIILETPGGYIEVVERIVAVLRRHYTEVKFVIPSFAYSAGTVLALSGDEIYMDYYSVLGPIDPQFQTDSGDPVPGMGYLAKYRDLVDKINNVDTGKEASVRAELAFLIQKFDPAKLFHIEQSIQHAEALLKDWLPKYKFRNWKMTKSRGVKVSEQYKEDRASQIAEKLGDAEHWHSHGRGISMKELAGDDIGLQIEDFGADPQMSAGIRHYFGLFNDYTQKLGAQSAAHTRLGLRRIQ